MAEGDWIRPETPREARETLGAEAPPARFELRPLSLGEVLDRSFSLYRSRFWLFAGISMVSATVYTVAQGISLTTASHLARHGGAVPGNSPAAVLANLRVIGTAQAGTYLVLLLYLLVSAVTQAATAWALAELYLARSVNVPGALRHVAPRWARWIGIGIWQYMSAAWVPFVALVVTLPLLFVGARSHNVGVAAIGGVLLGLVFLAGIPVGVVLFLRNALAIPAAAVEGLPVRQAMRRSKVLTKGTKGRIFVVLLVAYVLVQVVGVLDVPLGLLAVVARGGEHYVMRALALLLTFVGHTVVAPVAALGLTLVYFDQRVRQEALDLQVLLENAGSSDERNGMTESYGPLG